MRRVALSSAKHVEKNKIPVEIQKQFLYSPRSLNVQYGNKETLKFFREMREYVDSSKNNQLQLTVDLVNTEELEIGAALILVAEFDRWQRSKYIRLSPSTINTWQPNIINELSSLGFFKLLKTHVPPSSKISDDKACIQFVSDVQTIGRAAVLLRRRLEFFLGRSSLYDQKIYIGLIEAMKNAFQHAYPDDIQGWENDLRVGKRWWMAASIDRHRKCLQVAFLDLGITIPRSLPFSWMWLHLADEVRAGSHCDLIAEAMMYGTSRTAEPHRGKGFSNITSPTKLHRDNYVSVLSGRGICFATNDGVVKADLTEPLAGTLIKWYFALTE